ncbi:Heavy metal-associated domain containing protein [Quillaja saponaria]|uniref:Heavy metal-associated domain containing protein n=1 Tax=Quillaja saponaria TaxID=32244 RepID=A0AAD7L8E5_QUISA|nr:Heavy metal-associated domain containing protein [Quillaja saponaria]
MVQKTVLKVDISCLKCKKKLLKAVSSLQGVDKIEVDEAKGTLTVTGNADPYEIIVRTRKATKYAEVVSIGAPPAPPKPDPPKKPEEKKPELKAQIQTPHSCSVCERLTLVQVARWEELEPNPLCSIM